MSRIRTVNLELLRHGPSHNQLLSPLTRYLGLCGNHNPATVNVPFEHEHFLGRLNTLRYSDSSKTTQIQLKDMAQRMAEILAKMPGLIADLSDASAAQETITHLQLVLSASELALLPFELAYAPYGVPGAGQPLALQKQVPLSLTRQVRRTSHLDANWRRAPRVLFVSASPGAAGGIPLEAHLQALREVVDPWVFFYRRGNHKQRHKALDKHLVVLPEADIVSIEKICRQQDFTHVHILAHGVPITDGADEGFGLALHDPNNPAKMDKVDGTRLAAALRTSQPTACDKLSSPLVVSLASCDSGQVGSVVGAGASIAHELHAAGIPMVVASQFPLTFDGSVVMVRTLYRRLLEGDDPRIILSELRQQLRLQVPGSHDWASVVAYAALPADLEYQLQEVRLERAKRSIDAAINWIEGTIATAEEFEVEILPSKRDSSPEDSSRRPGLSQRGLRAIETAQARLEDGKARLERLADDCGLGRPAGTEAEVQGLMGSAEKREAQLLFNVAYLMEKPDHRRYRRGSRKALVRAMNAYRLGFEADRNSHWTLVQYLSLAIVLGAKVKAFEDRLAFARQLSEFDLESSDSGTAAWGHGSLAEIHMLSLATGNDPIASQMAVQHAREIVRLQGRGSFAVSSTSRQFERYLEWYLVISKNPAIKRMEPVAVAVIEALSQGLGPK